MTLEQLTQAYPVNARALPRSDTDTGAMIKEQNYGTV